jgi:hypothetical protein
VHLGREEIRSARDGMEAGDLTHERPEPTSATGVTLPEFST